MTVDSTVHTGSPYGHTVPVQLRCIRVQATVQYRGVYTALVFVLQYTVHSKVGIRTTLGTESSRESLSLPMRPKNESKEQPATNMPMVEA